MYRPTREPIFYGWVILLIASFFTFLITGLRSGFGIFVVPMSEEFGWDRATVSLAAAIGTILMGVMGPFAGRLVDRFGGRVVITSSLALTALSTTALTWTKSILYLILFYGVIGAMATSGASLATLGVIIARWFRRRRGTAMGLMASGMPLGQLLALPAILFLVNYAGWRATWAILGIAIAAVVPLSFLTLRNSPQEMGLQPDGGPTPPPGARTRFATHPIPLEMEQWPHSFRSIPIWQIMGGMVICGFTDISMGTHMVPYAQEEGFSATIIGLALVVLGATNVTGSLLAGVLSDRFGRKSLLLFAYTARAIAYGFLVFGHGLPALMSFVALAGLTWIATGPLTYSLTGDIYGLRHLGVLSGIVQMSHNVGAALGIYSYGLIRDLTGDYQLAFIIGGSSLVFAAVITTGISERRYSSRYQTPAG